MGKFDSMTSLTDFANERKLNKNTILSWLQNHPDVKKLVHYDRFNKNKIYLDDECLQILSEKYPLKESDSDTEQKSNCIMGNHAEIVKAILFAEYRREIFDIDKMIQLWRIEIPKYNKASDTNNAYDEISKLNKQKQALERKIKQMSDK